MVTGTNLYHTWSHYRIADLFADGHLDQFVTRVEYALEVQFFFDNNGHWNQFGTTDDLVIELLTYFDTGGHWNQIGTTV